MPQDTPAESDVWLVDHALSFTDLKGAIDELRSQPQLLQRLAAIVDLPGAPEFNGGEEEDNGLLQQLVDRMHTVVYEFVLQTSAEAGSGHKYRHVGRVGQEDIWGSRGPSCGGLTPRFGYLLL